MSAKRPLTENSQWWLRPLIASVLLWATSHQARCAGVVYPVGIAVSKQGDLFIADSKLPGIWRYSQGTLTVHLKGSNGFRTPLNAIRCLTIDGQGNLLAGDSGTREVYRVPGTVPAGKTLRIELPENVAPLTKGGIGIPQGVAVNSEGVIFVSDLQTHGIYKIPAGGGTPTRFADVASPLGIAFDADKNLWVATRGKPQVVKITPDGKVSPVVSEQALKFPQAIAVGGDKAVYVTDNYSKAVWKIPAGGAPALWAAGDPLKGPVGLAIQGDLVLVTDPQVPGLFSIDPAGKIKPLEIKSK